MSNLFNYTATDIEAQYKQDRYLQEAREYRLISIINTENRKTRSQIGTGRLLNFLQVIRSGMRRKAPTSTSRHVVEQAT
jgi:hypothetical protein